MALSAKGPTAKRRQSKARAKAATYRRAWELVDERDGKCCRVCGVFMFLPAHHHITFRSKGGKDSTDNLFCVCGDCHEDIHSHRITVSGNANERLQIERTA